MRMPINFDIGKINAMHEPVNAIIVASTRTGVSFAKSTFGGKAIIAASKVLIEVVVKMTHTMSGIPIARLSRKIKQMSKNDATIAVTIAKVKILRGSVNIK